VAITDPDSPFTVALNHQIDLEGGNINFSPAHLYHDGQFVQSMPSQWKFWYSIVANSLATAGVDQWWNDKWP